MLIEILMRMSLWISFPLNLGVAYVFARPKSMIQTWLLASTMMLAGLISR